MQATSGREVSGIKVLRGRAAMRERGPSIFGVSRALAGTLNCGRLLAAVAVVVTFVWSIKRRGEGLDAVINVSGKRPILTEIKSKTIRKSSRTRC